MGNDISIAPSKKLKKSAMLLAGLDQAPAGDSLLEDDTLPFVNDKKTCDDLVEKYLPYATSIATKIVKTLSHDIDYDDVQCNARLGLLEAARKFDAKLCTADFKTFAYYRIKGAIFDGLRKTGWLPRSLYSKIKFEQAANDYMENQNNSTAHVFDRDLDEISENINSLASVYVMSVDGMEDFELEDKEANKDIEHRAEFQKIKEKVCDAIESLPDKERKLIKMYYFQHKTLEDIGEQLGLSKSWTSRLHARSLELLFKKMVHLNGEEGESEE